MRKNRRDASRATVRHASTRTERTRTRVDARELFIGELFIHCRGWSFVFVFVFVFYFGCATSTTMFFSLSVTSCLLTSSTPPCVVAVLITATTYNPGGVWGPAGPLLGSLLYLSTYYLLCCCVAVLRNGACSDRIILTVVSTAVSMHDLLLLVWVR